MSKNYLRIYSEQLATEIELLCQNIKAPSNTLFQIRKSSSSIYANICEANYGQSKSDMVSKFEIALKECSETEGWLKLLFNTDTLDVLPGSTRFLPVSVERDQLLCLPEPLTPA